MSNKMKKNQIKKLFKSILRIRLIEEGLMNLYKEQDMRCPTHFSIGQEAVASGVCANLNLNDNVISAHRSHAHYLAKGGSLKAMIAELYGKSTGCASGKGGSMHLVDPDVNFLGCVPIVGSAIPIGVGAAFGNKLKNKKILTAIFIGDGAIETGVFHESINFAALHSLPILFICENNNYSVNTGLDERQPSNRKIVDIVRGHGIQSHLEDGQEVEKVFEIVKKSIYSMKENPHPVFFEFETYRWLEHCGPNYDNQLNYRPDGEFEKWIKRDPLKLIKSKLLKDKIIDNDTLVSYENEIRNDFEEAVNFAKSSPFPEKSEMYKHVFPN